MIASSKVLCEFLEIMSEFIKITKLKRQTSEEYLKVVVIHDVIYITQVN